MNPYIEVGDYVRRPDDGQFGEESSTGSFTMEAGNDNFFEELKAELQ